MSRARRPARLTAARRKLLDQLLDEVLDLEPAERQWRVQQLAEHHPRLGQWLHRLVKATADTTEVFDRSPHHLVDDALQARTGSSPDTLKPGDSLGPWEVVEHVGSGGMGEVYRGQRADGAFEMQVAIKVIGSPSPELGELLVAERQAMARLNHAAIARLIDGGKTQDGQPFLVMEWVDGEPLGEWISRCDPAPSKMLHLFKHACNAVAIAHRQLIVHGDIKPANLLVEAGGDLKLLDFGVARLLDAGAGKSLPLALTPGFAAPEQLQGEPIATAADIYGLGALLHWMVFGRAPDRAERRVLPAWAGYKRLKDLKAIIERATASRPDDRYATVNAMLLELERLTENRPVRARWSGPIERTNLWVQRHRVGASLGAVALISILVGLSTFAYQARLVALERDVARTEAALSEAVREHLIFLFREVGTLAEDTEELTARELLNQTAEVASDWLEEEPEIRQQVLAVLGEIMIALHDYHEAEPLLAEFLEEDTARTSPVLRSMALRDLAQVYHRRGRLEEAAEAIEQSASLISEFPGEHPARWSDIMQIRGRINRDRGLWQEALADLRQGREYAQQAAAGPRPLMARAENNLATTLLMTGQLAEAARHFETAEALWYSLGRPESSDALAVMSNLAVTLDRLGRSQEAEQRLRRVIELRRRHYGDSAAMAAARLQLGRILVNRGRLAEAQEHLEQAGTIFRRFVGDDSPDYGAGLIGLGELAQAQGDHEQALAYFRRSREIMHATVGPRHPYAIQASLGIAGIHQTLDPAVARDQLGELEQTARELGGAGRMLLAAIRCEQAAVWIDTGAYDEALAAARECLELREGLSLGGWRLTEARLAIQLASLLAAATDADLEKCRQVLERMEEQTHAGHPLVRQAYAMVADRLADG